MALKNGMQVRVITPVIEGTVVGGAFLDGEPHYLVQYPGADGETHQGYFPAEKLEVVSE